MERIRQIPGALQGLLVGLPFFVAPVPDRPLLPRRLADYLQGFGLVWVMQLHMSWTLLVPFAGFAWLARARRGQGLAAPDYRILGTRREGTFY